MKRCLKITEKKARQKKYIQGINHFQEWKKIKYRKWFTFSVLNEKADET